MRVTKCDLCRKSISGELVTAGTGHFYNNKELCHKCGKPILDFLEKHEFIEDKKREQKIAKKT